MHKYKHDILRDLHLFLYFKILNRSRGYDVNQILVNPKKFQFHIFRIFKEGVIEET